MPDRHSSDAGAPRPRHRDLERLTAFPLVGPYKASKQAIEGFTEALAQELACFDVRR